MRITSILLSGALLLHCSVSPPIPEPPTGLLGPATRYQVDQQPRALALADLNGDGYLDVVTANEGRSRALPGGTDSYPMGAGALLPRFQRRPKAQDVGSVSVLLGQAGGGLGPRQDYAVGRYPTSLAVGDLNHDGYPDLVVADTDFDHTPRLTVLPGRGDGRFGAALRYPGSFLRSADLLTLADLDGDGWLDVVTTGEDGTGALRVLFNRGQLPLGFRTDTTLTIPNYSPRSLHLVNAGPHGHLNVLVTGGEGYAPDSTLVLVPVGAGGQFGTAQEYPAEWGPTAVGDVDGDGRPDVVSASAYGIAVRRAGPHGLEPARRYAGVGHQVYTTHLADMNRDGILDLLLNHYPQDLEASGALSILPGQAGGGFGPATTYPLGTYSLEHFAVGDLNADGQPDVVALDRNPQALYVLLGHH